MANGERTLRRAVRLAVVGKYLGQLCLVLALLNLAPLAVSVYFAEYHISWLFLVVIGTLFLISLAVRLPAPAELQRNEALVIVALAFILSPLLMIIPMHGAGPSYAEAWFEAVSAVTTTGLTTLTSVEGHAHSFLFARAWMQWYGGLGIAVLSVALLTGHHMASRRLAEPLGGEGLATTTRTYARRMFSVYIVLTLTALSLLLLSGVDGFAALTHSLSAVSTGGFSTFNQSLADMHLPVQAALVILVGLMGAVPMHLYYLARHGGLMQALRDSELLTLLLLALLTAFSLSLLLRQSGMEWSAAFYHGTLQGISALSTSGFSTLDIKELSDGAKLTLIVSMLIGGGVGSTAGGIKILRLLILLRLLQLMLQRTALPEHAVIVPKLSGNELEGNEIQNALLLILLFVIVVLISWALFVFHGYAPLDALFEVVSATGTVGMSTGITTTGLEPLLQQVLVLDMLFGRLEIVALLVLLYPPTWFGKRVET
jgi:trk system potassium uptake protein TrkH